MPVVHDALSKGAVVAVVVVNLFFILMASEVDAWQMSLYLVMASAAVYFFARIKFKDDPKLTKGEARNISVWALLGVAGLAFANWLSQGLFIGTLNIAFLSTAGMMASVSLAVSETLYFQGAMFSYLKRYGVWVAFACIMGLGLLFHLRMYGTSPSDLLYAGLGYGLLTWLVIKTKRFTVALTVHFINNVMGFIIGPFMVFVLAAVAFGVLNYQKKLGWRMLT